MAPMEKQIKESTDSPAISKEQKRIAREIEAVFEKFYGGKTAYSRGQFYKDDFFLRTDYALVVLNKNNEILVSFADHTRPSYAALFAFMLEGIEGANLFICEDYRTDEDGSMVCDEEDGSTTAAIIWDQKERYYTMLKRKIEHIVIRRTRKPASK
ncbi:MAG: hypothetical protein H6Q48_698 [Deltaproteobacteria bacterium]|nr:hypothetical protein [Deltaproteobacteria bacterium]